MPSKTETGPRFVNTFETRETEKPNHAEGSLRDDLLSKPEVFGSFLLIPRGTVAVEANSNTLTTESFFENSENVDALREKRVSFLDQTEGNATLFGGGMHMSHLHDERMRRERKQPTGNNLTFLYDQKEHVAEGELRVPSAVLVHEQLDELQIAQLRETLPPDVPMIDANTNELLDDVGQETRERRRERRRRQDNVGHAASLQMMRNARQMDAMLNGFTNNSSARTFYNSPEGETEAYYDDNANEEGWGQTRTAGDYDQWDEGTTTTEERAGTTEEIPESDEVRQHREKLEAEKAKQEEEARIYAENAASALRERNQKAQEAHKLVDEASQEKYGRPVDELTDKERTSLRRDAAKKYHPDYAASNDTADREKFEAFDQVLK